MILLIKKFLGIDNLFNELLPEILTADGDLVVGNILYEIKCTKKDNFIYNILQLLGYSALLLLNPKYKRKISYIRVINFLQGEIYYLDISSLDKSNYENYLSFLCNINYK